MNNKVTDSCKEIRLEARKSLEGNWRTAVLGVLIFVLIPFVISGYINWNSYFNKGNLIEPEFGLFYWIYIIAIFLCTGAIMLGYAGFFLKISRKEEVEVANIFDGFKNFWSAFLTYLLIAIFVFLWTFLIVLLPVGIFTIITTAALFSASSYPSNFLITAVLIIIMIPTYIAVLAITSRYALSFFILFDEPKISSSKAIKKSKQLMKGNIWKLIKLLLSFIGWYLLTILTLGIGSLWLTPYLYTSIAIFYDKTKRDDEIKENQEVISINIR